MAKKSFDIKAKNPQQKEAIKALLDAEIDLVVMDGCAGSGKTFLAIATALYQIFDLHMYTEVVFTRAPVAVGNSGMGFLPGTEEDKMKSWCGGLYDNIEALYGNSDMTKVVIESKVRIRAIEFMRGRSFQNRIVIIDEVQNITTQQLKVLLTRAGEGTKVICLGDTDQIDNTKLNKADNALSVLCAASEASGAEFIKYIKLPEGVRSRLSNWATQSL